MVLGLGRSHHESRIGHIGIDFLNDESFWTRFFVLVGPFRIDLVLPRLLTPHVLRIAHADIRHDMVDGVGDTVLTGARSGHQTVHQRGLMPLVVDVAEIHLPQMHGQRGEYRMRHRRLVDIRCPRYQQVD